VHCASVSNCSAAARFALDAHAAGGAASGCATLGDAEMHAARGRRRRRRQQRAARTSCRPRRARRRALRAHHASPPRTRRRARRRRSARVAAHVPAPLDGDVARNDGDRAPPAP
jgi:hypothetical protein